MSAEVIKALFNGDDLYFEIRADDGTPKYRISLNDCNPVCVPGRIDFDIPTLKVEETFTLGTMWIVRKARVMSSVRVVAWASVERVHLARENTRLLRGDDFNLQGMFIKFT